MDITAAAAGAYSPIPVPATASIQPYSINPWQGSMDEEVRNERQK